MSDYLPEEVVVEILLRLPVKSLIRCSTVCKSWNSLVESSAFMDTHLNRRNGDSNLLLVKIGDRYEAGFLDRSLLYNHETGESNNLILPSLLVQPKGPNQEVTFSEFEVHGTCNGLILSSRSNRPYCLIIWNPSIRRFVVLPRPRVVRKSENLKISYAFGFDMPTNDYKVLRILSNMGGFHVSPMIPCEVEVYSLALGCWKRLSSAVVPKNCMEFQHAVPVLLNGALHWFRNGHDRDNSIVTFDMYNEIFSEMVVPDAMANGQRFPCMSGYGESLAIVDIARFEGFEEVFDAIVHVWVMKEYGVGDSWSMLYSVRLRDLPHLTITPFGLTRNGEFMVDMMYSGLFYVGFNSREAVRFEIKGSTCEFVDCFVESLVLLRQANAMSY